MRIANLDGRLVLLDRTRCVDVEKASNGRFEADPQRVYDRWDDFRRWASSAHDLGGEAFDSGLLGSPAPRPAQVFAIGLNYSEHAAEAGFASPDAAPPVFTKFPACITGPYGDVVCPLEGTPTGRWSSS